MITLLTILSIWIIISIIHVIRHGMDDSIIAQFGTLIGVALLIFAIVIGILKFLP